MSSAGDTVSISAGTEITAGVLTDLLARIKTEFNRRACTGAGEALKYYVTNNFSSFTSNDTAGTSITAANANTILKAIEVLGVKDTSTASNPLAAGDLIEVEIVNTAYSTIKTMEAVDKTATTGNAGCKGAC